MQLANLMKSCGLAALAAALAIPMIPETAAASTNADTEASADQQRRGDRDAREDRRGNREARQERRGNRETRRAPREQVEARSRNELRSCTGSCPS